MSFIFISESVLHNPGHIISEGKCFGRIFEILNVFSLQFLHCWIKNLVPIEKLMNQRHSNGIESISTSLCPFMLTRYCKYDSKKNKLRTTKN